MVESLEDRARNLYSWGVRLKTLRELDDARAEIARQKISLSTSWNVRAMVEKELREARAENERLRNELVVRVEKAEAYLYGQSVASTHEFVPDTCGRHCAFEQCWGVEEDPIHRVVKNDNRWRIAHEYVEPQNVGALCEFITHITTDGLGTVRCNEPREDHRKPDPYLWPDGSDPAAPGGG